MSFYLFCVQDAKAEYPDDVSLAGLWMLHSYLAQ